MRYGLKICRVEAGYNYSFYRFAYQTVYRIGEKARYKRGNGPLAVFAADDFIPLEFTYDWLSRRRAFGANYKIFLCTYERDRRGSKGLYIKGMNSVLTTLPPFTDLAASVTLLEEIVDFPDHLARGTVLGTLLTRTGVPWR